MKWLKNNKGKLVSVLAVVLILAGAYFFDRGMPENSKKDFDKSATQSLSLPEKNSADIKNDGHAVQNSENNTMSDEVSSETETPKNEEVPSEPTVPETVEVTSESAAPETAETTDEEPMCALSVRCDTINQNLELLDKSKRGLIPADGIIFRQDNVVIYEGDSVFDVLLREMKNNKIHFEYVNTPMYNSVYLEGINNIYEFDCGPGSGWLYRVNGVFPNCGSSQYKITNGDIIELVYTCDMGKDVGKN